MGKSLKIGQYLAQIWTKVCGLVFLAHPVDCVDIATLQGVPQLEGAKQR